MNYTQIVKQARTWMDTPFHHQARLKNVGCDCLGLVMGVAKELGLKDKFGDDFYKHDIKDYSMAPDTKFSIETLERVLHIVSVESVRPGDLAMFKILSNPQHLAFITDFQGGIGMIHCDNSIKKVVEHRLDSRWRSRLFRAFRFSNLTT